MSEETTDPVESPLHVFLGQPVQHTDETPTPAKDDEAISQRRWWKSLNNFMFSKKSSPYSSVAPRRVDGERAKIFFFNGGGRGR